MRYDSRPRHFEDPALPSVRARLSALAMKSLLRPRLAPSVAPDAQRRALALFSRGQSLPRGIRVEAGTLAGRPTLQLSTATSKTDTLLLYLHGGGYCIGSPSDYQVACGYLARACDGKVVVLDYRLAPEHPFPAALDDALAAYQELRRRYPAAQIALAGDSAGAGLALALVQRRRDQQLDLPACLVLFCPFGDLRLRGASWQRNRHREPLLTREWLALCAEYYAADADPDDPLLSPQYADFRGFPPLLIQAAGNDVLLDDARAIHAAARDAGVASKLDVFADLGHDFQMQPGVLPEAQRALAMAGAFIKVQRR